MILYGKPMYKRSIGELSIGMMNEHNDNGHLALVDKRSDRKRRGNRVRDFQRKIMKK